MTDWTPEAKDYLDGYLRQVGALARHQGDDADEIVTELRDHVMREAEQDAGAMVTLDHLRKTLAAIGTPEQVVAIDAPFRASATAAVTPSESPPRKDAPKEYKAPPQVVVQQVSPRSRTGCWIAAIVFVLVFLAVVSIPILATVYSIVVPGLSRARISADRKAAVAAMQSIVAAQARFQAEGHRDADGDGVGDYATLAELADPDGTGTAPAYIDSTLSAGTKQGYRFTVTVTTGSAEVPPSYTCTAVPLSERMGYLSYFVDESGPIRFNLDGTMPTVASTPLS